MLLFCSVAFLLASSVAASEEDGRIVRGVIVHVSQASFAVQLRRNGATYCGGIVITPTMVMTAAHCLEDGVDNIQVAANANTIFEVGTQRSVINHVIPTEYSRKTLFRDIAILKLNSTLDGEIAKPLPLCSKPWTPGEPIQVLGWGTVNERNTRSRNLRSIDINMIPREECLSKNDLLPLQNDSRECAAGEGQDACKGDSGGPAVFQGEVCGVISAGAGCADPRYPGLYTSVYNMRAFILNAIETL